MEYQRVSQIFFNKSVFLFEERMIFLKFALSKFETDSIAQLVEHIPFKDGVLGSSPSWITKPEIENST